MRLQCPTCLELFTPEDDLQCPPCGHVFHRHCIHEWFNYKRASGDREDCPQCRTVTKIQKLRRIYPTEAYVEPQENSDEDLHIQIEEIQNRVQIKIKIKRYLFFALVAINILLFGLGVSYHYNALLNDA